jgi:hypothetical protein
MRDFGTPTRESRESQESRDKMAIWMPPPRRVTEYTIRGKVVASPQGPGRGESYVSVLPVACPNTKGIQNEF